MPIYEFCCKRHGRFDAYREMTERSAPEPCPHCYHPAPRIISLPSITIKNKRQLAYGRGVFGKVMTGAETGGLDIFVPSFGAMEQDEVDYIAMGAAENERARVKKVRKQGARSEAQARLGAYADLGRRAKRGQRAKTIREAIKETGDRLVKTTA